MAEEQELKFPIEHEKCPACGSTRRVANEVKKQEEAKGKVRPQAKFGLGSFQAAISDPGVVTLRCPIITSIIDVCADCGCVWSPMTDCHEQELKPVTQARGGGMPPFIGRG